MSGLNIGDEVKLIKEMGPFEIGKKFTIVSIDPVYRVIMMLSIELNCIAPGIGVSYDGFDEYFERVFKKCEIKKSWAEWTETKSGFKFRTDNEKYVEVKKDGITVHSSCHPCDKFSVAKGVSVCLQKIKDKKRKVEDVKKVDNISNKELLIDLIQSMPGDIIDLSYDITHGINTDAYPPVYTGITHCVFRFSQIYKK